MHVGGLFLSCTRREGGSVPTRRSTLTRGSSTGCQLAEIFAESGEQMPEQRKTQVLVEMEEEIAQRLQTERARLRRDAGLVQLKPFQRPVERAFGAEERDNVTILFGGLTWKHEEMIKAVFHGNGYKCEIVPPERGRVSAR